MTFRLWRCFDFKPRLAKKSVTTSSIWLPVLVDHWVEIVGGREFTDWLLLARVCRGFLQRFARVCRGASRHKGGRGSPSIGCLHFCAL